MADYPDFMSFAGRNVVGTEIKAHYFTGTVYADGYTIFTLPDVPEGYEYVYQSVIISSSDDAAIHKVRLYRRSDLDTFFSANFVMNGTFNFPGQAIGAGDQFWIEAWNYSDTNLIFHGMVFYVVRPL